MSAERAPVVITGASGFIGRHLVAELLGRGRAVRALVRHASRARLPAHPRLEVCEIADILDAPWGELLAGGDSLVHLAAIAHRGAPRRPSEERRVRAVNRNAVGEITCAACACRLRRMVLLSSIGVLGANSGSGAYRSDSPPAPHDFYSLTKLEGERLAAEESRGAALSVCIVRAPLVFGPDAPGNFARLLAWTRRGVPLPFAAIGNRRSLVSVWNLCDLIALCLEHPDADRAPVLAGDDEAPSTPELLRRCAQLLGTRARLVAAPVPVLRAAASVFGRAADFERLCGSLVIDTGETRERLGWRPPLTLDEGLRRTLAGAREAIRAPEN
jgi:nucleoside-diphosphate-sugar epimerase